MIFELRLANGLSCRWNDTKTYWFCSASGQERTTGKTFHFDTLAPALARWRCALMSPCFVFPRFSSPLLRFLDDMVGGWGTTRLTAGTPHAWACGAWTWLGRYLLRSLTCMQICIACDCLGSASWASWPCSNRVENNILYGFYMILCGFHMRW